MPLNTKVVTLPKDKAAWGRDAGKSFLITEMPALQAEKWGMRVFLVIKGTGAQIPQNISGLGMVGIAIIGLNAILQSDVDFAKLEPLLDEMLTCVQAIPTKNIEDARPLIPGEIEEVATLGMLRSEVIELHTGFSVADSLSKLILEIMKTANSLTM